jgi:hypothetical protein
MGKVSGKEEEGRKGILYKPRGGASASSTVRRYDSLRR